VHEVKKKPNNPIIMQIWRGMEIKLWGARSDIVSIKP